MTASTAYKASWTPERKAAQAERMRQQRWAKLTPQQQLEKQREAAAKEARKAARAEAKAKADAEKAEARAVKEAARAKRQQQRASLQQDIRDRGGTVRTPEQREEARLAYLAKRDAWKAEQAGKRRYEIKPSWPQSLDDLRSGCGPHGDTVAAHAVAIAIRTWACDRLDSDGMPSPATLLAVRLP